MKKCLSMLMAMGAILFASTLCATDTGVINSENFDGNTSSGAPRFTVGDPLNVKTAYDGDSALYWASTEAEEGGSMGDLATIADKGEGDKYLKVETGAPLYRYVNGGGVTEEIGSGLYFEGDVQFSPYEEDVDMSDAEVKNKGTKLLVYLKSTTEGEGTESESTTYNFVVVAGYYDADNGVTTKYYKCAVPTDFNCEDKDIWHHLVLKANLTSNGYYTYFKVMIDGTYLTCDEAKGDVKSVMAGIGADSFPSLDTSYAPIKLEAIGFKGSGAIDNIVWTNEDPAPTKVKKAFVWENGTFMLTVNGTETEVVSGTTYEFNETDDLDRTFVANEGYAWDDATDEPEKTESDGVTTYTYKPAVAGVLVTIGETSTYVKDFAAAVTLANAQKSDVTIKLIADSEVGSDNDDGTSFAEFALTLILNGKSLTVNGGGLFAGGTFKIIDKSELEVTDDGIITSTMIYGPNIYIYGGKFSTRPKPDDTGTVTSGVDGYELSADADSDDYYRLHKTGGSTEPTIDGDSSASIDPSSKTITVDSNTTAEIKINGDASAYTITVPAKVTKITGSVKEVVIKTGDIVITGAFTVDSATTAGVTTIALNPEGKITVNEVEISVTPELATSSDEVKPFDMASDGVSATVKAIPGLTYQLYASTDVSTVKTAGTAVGDAVTAGTTGSVTLKDTSATESAKFYVIRVTR